MELLNMLKCNKCEFGNLLALDAANGTCGCGNKIYIKNNIVNYSNDKHLQTIPEVNTRDNQSSGYLSHSKFPIQIYRIEEFLDNLPENIKAEPVLDLGCGPGPTTNLLLKRGYEVVAVDFSEKSLQINQEINSSYESKVMFVKADLNEINFRPASTKLLMMCDFLQHLGDYEKRASFIRKIFDSLMPGGWFYITFFNFNMKNYFKRDVRGSFAEGSIKYERLFPKEVVEMLPANITIHSVIPMNIVHSVMMDRILSVIPGASYLSRMFVIAGEKGDNPPSALEGG